jgi:hypothetical protein
MGSSPSQPWNFAAPGTTGGPQQTIPGGAPAYNPGASGWAPDFNYAAPGTIGGPQQTIGPGGQQPSLWDRLLKVAGALGTKPGAAPGTTFGAPAGAPGASSALPPPPPMLPQTQMPAPPGMGAYFRALQQPAGAGGGNNALMAQYMALQQLMRGG